MRTDMPSGGWVEHLPIQDLRGKHKRNLDRVGKPRPVFRNGEFDQDATMSGLDVLGWSVARRDAVWAMIITGWSYDLPVPVLGDDGQVVNVDSYGELPFEDFEELERLAEPYETKLNRKPDPKAQAAGIISGSNGSSRAKPAGSRMA